MKKSRQKRIGVIRGVVPRLTQAEYASHFSRLKPVFISSGNRQVGEFCRKAGLEWRQLELGKIYGVDPVKWVLGKQTHQSWVRLKGLEEACRDLDVLEVHELFFFDSGQAAKVAEKLRIPLVVDVWTSMVEHLSYKLPPYSWGVKKVIRQADLFVARSKLAKKALVKLGVERKKIKRLYYGVNLKRFYPRKKGQRQDKELRVLFVGRMEKFKGVGRLLDIWERVKKKQPRAKLWLVGGGSLVERAKEVEGVKVLGYVAHGRLPEIYRQVDIFASPSEDLYLGPFKWADEYFSHTLMEAQASGLPIVATRCGGIPEEVGDNNWLVDQRDSEQLLKAVIDCLSNEKKRRRAGEENRQRAERLYDLGKQVSRLEEEIIKL